MSRCTSVFVLLAAVVGGSTNASSQEPPAASRAAGASGYHLAATWKVGGDGGWDYLSVDPQAHRLYVTRPDRVQVLDTETGAIVGEVPGLDGTHGVALVTDIHRGFASSGKSDTVLVFDLETLKKVGDPIPVGNKPDAIIYDPASRRVFAFNGRSDNASVIDAASAKVIATIPLGGGPEFAVSDGRGTVFVNLEEQSETVAIDVKTNAVIHRWPLAPGEGPSGISMDAARGRVFAGCHNEQMIVLDAGTGKVLGNPAIGKGVDACAFDPGTGFAFASNGDGTLTVIKEEPQGEFRVIANVLTKKSARTMALDPLTHAIYLAAADLEPAPTPAPGAEHVRPKMIPGTFVILKFVR